MSPRIDLGTSHREHIAMKRIRGLKKGCMTVSAVLFIIVGLFLCGPAYGNPLIHFYQEVISPVDGDRCPMVPSCSEYARQAVEKHGPVIGWIMAFDRLQRCGRDTVAHLPAVTKNGARLCFDPVEANDFWWFKKDGSK